jgi:hypothetical protein
MLRELASSDYPAVGGKAVLAERKREPQIEATLIGYEPDGHRIGYACDAQGRLMCFDSHLLNVFLRASSRVTMADKCLLGRFGSTITALVMPIAIPFDRPTLEQARSFFNGGRGEFPDQGCGS